MLWIYMFLFFQLRKKPGTRNTAAMTRIQQFSAGWFHALLKCCPTNYGVPACVCVCVCICVCVFACAYVHTCERYKGLNEYLLKTHTEVSPFQKRVCHPTRGTIASQLLSMGCHVLKRTSGTDPQGNTSEQNMSGRLCLFHALLSEWVPVSSLRVFVLSDRLHYMSCHLADAFIQSHFQLIRLSRRHTPPEQCAVKGLAQGNILLWPHQGSNPFCQLSPRHLSWQGVMLFEWLEGIWFFELKFCFWLEHRWIHTFKN